MFLEGRRETWRLDEEVRSSENSLWHKVNRSGPVISLLPLIPSALRDCPSSTPTSHTIFMEEPAKRKVGY